MNEEAGPEETVRVPLRASLVMSFCQVQATCLSFIPNLPYPLSTTFTRAEKGSIKISASWSKAHAAGFAGDAQTENIKH